jgi:hypothetical protein
MSRRDNTMVEDVEQVEETGPEVETSEGEELAPEASATEPKAKAKKEKSRGDLPEGYVTPVGLATAITKAGLYTDKNGTHVLPPQQVYSMKKNDASLQKLMVTVNDSLGKPREVLKLDAGLEWYVARKQRVAARSAAAATKAQEKAAKATKAATAEAESVDEDASEAPVTEAE